VADAKAASALTLGDPTIEASNQFLGGSLNGCKFQFTRPTGQYSGTMNVYISSAYAGLATNYKGVFGIYEVATGKRVAVSAQTVGLANGWNTIALVGNFQLVNGAWYWLAMHTPPLFYVAIRTSASGVGVAGQYMWISTTTKTYDGTLPATLPTFAGTNARIASIYTSLATSGTSPPPSTDQTTPPPATDATTPAPSSNTNLAAIPNNWCMTYGSGKQIIFLDNNVVRTPGKPSIRLEQHTTADVNTNRECNGKWYPVKPGDHIVAKCWIKVDATYINTDPYCGGRLGMDLYGSNGAGGITILDSYPHDGAQHTASEVHWGTVGWTLRTWDIIVQNTIYTKDLYGNTIPATPITKMVLWLDVRPVTATGLVWFADAELYINPI